MHYKACQGADRYFVAPEVAVGYAGALHPGGPMRTSAAMPESGACLNAFSVPFQDVTT